MKYYTKTYEQALKYKKQIEDAGYTAEILEYNKKPLTHQGPDLSTKFVVVARKKDLSFIKISPPEYKISRTEQKRGTTAFMTRKTSYHPPADEI